LGREASDGRAVPGLIPLAVRRRLAISLLLSVPSVGVWSGGGQAGRCRVKLMV
jgi:hypothetical protein